MAYDSPQFIGVDVIEPAAPLAAISQTMTASGAIVTSTYTAVNDVRVPANAVLVGGFVVCDTAGAGQGYICQVQSGTKVLSTATVVNTAGSAAVFPTDTSSSVVAAAGAFSVSIIGTGTASAAQNSPALRVALQVRYQFV